MSKKETLIHTLIWVIGILILMFNPFLKIKINSYTYHFVFVFLNIILTYVLALYFLPEVLTHFSLKKLLYVLIFYCFMSFIDSSISYIAQVDKNLIWLFKGTIANIISNVFFLIVAFTITLSRLWYQKNVLSQTLMNDKLKAELSFLNSQVNPHFMFNSLNTIYGLAIKENAEKTQKATQELSELFRYLLENSTKEFISLSDEINYISAYIDFQKLRLPETASITFDQKLSDNIQLPPFIIIPIVENAFKYAVGFNTGIFIDINITVTNEKFRLRVTNSINQTHEELSEASTGIGLTNLKRRLELHFKDNYKLSTKEENGRYYSELIITLHHR